MKKIRNIIRAALIAGLSTVHACAMLTIVPTHKASAKETIRQAQKQGDQLPASDGWSCFFKR